MSNKMSVSLPSFQASLSLSLVAVELHLWTKALIDPEVIAEFMSSHLLQHKLHFCKYPTVISVKE